MQNHASTGASIGAQLTAPPPSLISDLEGAKLQERLFKADLYNTITLRGIIALEAGETKQARTIFEAVLKEAANEAYFSDAPIAARYLELLDAQKR